MKSLHSSYIVSYRITGKAITVLSTIILFIISGCTTSRRAAGSAEAVFIESISKRWQQINVPVEVIIDSPVSISATGRLYMMRDSNIYLTLRFLGMEVGNLSVTRDSIFIADKINKQYIAEPITEILAETGLTLSNIQDILAGQVFVPTSTQAPTSAQFNIASSGRKFITATPHLQPHDARLTFVLSTETNTLSTLSLTTQGRDFAVQYSGAYLTSYGIFPTSATIVATIGNTLLSVTLNSSFKSAKWEANPPKWRAPKSARRISATNLLRNLNF